MRVAILLAILALAVASQPSFNEERFRAVQTMRTKFNLPADLDETEVLYKVDDLLRQRADAEGYVNPFVGLLPARPGYVQSEFALIETSESDKEKINPIDIASTASDAYGYYQDSQAQTTVGKVAETGGKVAVDKLVGMNPVVSGVDAVLPQDLKLSDAGHKAVELGVAYAEAKAMPDGPEKDAALAAIKEKALNSDNKLVKGVAHGAKMAKEGYDKLKDWWNGKKPDQQQQQGGAEGGQQQGGAEGAEGGQQQGGGGAEGAEGGQQQGGGGAEGAEGAEGGQQQGGGGAEGGQEGGGGGQEGGGGGQEEGGGGQEGGGGGQEGGGQSSRRR